MRTLFIAQTAPAIHIMTLVRGPIALCTLAGALLGHSTSPVVSVSLAAVQVKVLRNKGSANNLHQIWCTKGCNLILLRIEGHL